MEKKTHYAKMYKIHSSQKEDKELHKVLLLDGIEYLKKTVPSLESVDESEFTYRVGYDSYDFMNNEISLFVSVKW